MIAGSDAPPMPALRRPRCRCSHVPHCCSRHIVLVATDHARRQGAVAFVVKYPAEAHLLGSADALPLRSFDMVGEYEAAFRSLQVCEDEESGLDDGLADVLALLSA